MNPDSSEDLLSARSLSKIPLFKNFSFSELAELRSAMEVQRRIAGATILREGQGGSRDFFVVLEGAVDILSGGVKVAERGQYALVGEMAFIANRKRVATVAAANDCVLLRASSEKIMELLTRNPMLAWKVMEALASLLCDRFEETDRKMREIVRKAPPSLQAEYDAARQETLPDLVLEE
jgi:CRP-like cAMP-binding protein